MKSCNLSRRAMLKTAGVGAVAAVAARGVAGRSAISAATADQKPIKISDVKATPLKTGTVIVQVFTDAGVVGIGECSPMNTVVVAGFVNTALRPLLIDQNPLGIDVLWNKMMFKTYKLGPQGAQPEAIAGVDIALWDILGKVTGQPIHMLLGGCYRDVVQLYASIGGGGNIQPERMVKRVEDALERGFKAVKIRMDWGPMRQDRDPEKDLEMFRQVKAVTGDGIPVGFDANNGYSVSTAIRQGRKFEELGISHYEEPVAQFDYAGLAQVADALDVPVAAGEHEYTRWQFRDLILEGKIDIIQPDVVKCAGISECWKIATLGSAFNKMFVPHQTQPTIGTVANIHICAAIPNADRPQEYGGAKRGLDEVFVEAPVVENGMMRVPSKPGLGLEIVDAKLKKLAV
ncbi:MAG TPA: mandelate racemase/muconate lactonizing enzyme family protein [Candidatus Bathyarchaeia archaeon]|nr:mandelate racemase/muconate lactonizing enzyme family protein [Candidatus Bathyarchaeia archaeon]